jgi:hypothetical protein
VIAHTFTYLCNLWNYQGQLPIIHCQLVIILVFRHNYLCLSTPRSSECTALPSEGTAPKARQNSKTRVQLLGRRAEERNKLESIRKIFPFFHYRRHGQFSALVGLNCWSMYRREDRSRLETDHSATWPWQIPRMLLAPRWPE